MRFAAYIDQVSDCDAVLVVTDCNTGSRNRHQHRLGLPGSRCWRQAVCSSREEVDGSVSDEHAHKNPFSVFFTMIQHSNNNLAPYDSKTALYVWLPTVVSTDIPEAQDIHFVSASYTCTLARSPICLLRLLYSLDT